MRCSLLSLVIYSGTEARADFACPTSGSPEGAVLRLLLREGAEVGPHRLLCCCYLDYLSFASAVQTFNFLQRFCACFCLVGSVGAKLESAAVCILQSDQILCCCHCSLPRLWRMLAALPRGRFG